MGGIVVGVDRSHHSLRALSWAMKEAALRRTALTVLTVQQSTISSWSDNPNVAEDDKAELGKDRRTVEEAVREVAGQLGEAKRPSVTVRGVMGSPAEELLDASRDAELLVVGSRGSGGFAKLLLGSVSSELVQHASCPVVVVPHER